METADAATDSEASARAAESELVRRAQGGDTDAFRTLVDLHRDRAYALALRIVRAPADAEEVAQDGFVRAWLALPRFRGDARFATWLHRIVLRRALDRAAVLARRRAREVAEPPPDSPAPAGANQRKNEIAGELEAAMQSLSEVQRVVVTLFYLHDRSVAEVAGTLGLPDGTVKTHLHRARAVLREAWRRRVSP